MKLLRFAAGILLAGALLVGCEVSEPGKAHPSPSPASSAPAAPQINVNQQPPQEQPTAGPYVPPVSYPAP